MLLKRSVGFAAVITVLAGCEGAKFRSTPNSSREPSPIAKDAVICSVSPTKVKIENVVYINVSAGSDVKGPLYQTVTGEDAADQSELLRHGDVFWKTGTQTNTAFGKKEGDHIVEIRKVAGSEKPDATCSFAIDDKNGETTFDPKDAPPGTFPPGKYPPGITPPDDSTVDGSNPKDPNDPKDPVDPKDPPAAVCRDDQKSIGADVAFIVDNSNSNAATDCPNPRKTGTFNGADTYECQGQTNREKAVLAAFDILVGVASKDATNADAKSNVAVASFPTKENYQDGWKLQTSDWVSAAGTSERQVINNAMSFARNPYGLTPYGSGLTAAKQLFKPASTDERAKIMVLVTDGEPTDRDPLGVIAQAESLRAAGVELITVFVTGTETREQRKTNHANMLRRFNEASMKNGSGTWYTGAVASFDDYIEIINGSADRSDLVSQVSDKKDSTCIESNGKTCDRLVVEVADSSSLRSVLEGIIRTRAIKCK